MLRLLYTLLVLSSAPAYAVSFQAERELGSQFALAARTQLPLITDAEIVGFVNRVGGKITAGLEDSFFEYNFYVVRDNSINAFAVPGGHIYVHTGLLSRVSNEDELAGVLGHEIAHVHAHHLARQQEATQLMSYATLLGMLLSVVQPAVGAVASAANAATQLHYRREFEQEADYMGARYMQAAGYNPQGILDFFKKLADEQRLTPTFVPPYLLSHPLTDERLNRLEAVLKKQQWSGTGRSPTSFELKRVQALVRARSEPPGEVLKAYRAAVLKDPANAEARYLFGLVCLETGQLDAAREALEEARAAGFTLADRELGRIALRLRDLEKARTLLRHAVEEEPKDAAALFELAQALEVLGDNKGAMDAYRRALELAPDLEAAHYGLGILAGRAHMEAAGYYHLASAFRLRGEYAKALSQYARAEPLLPLGDPRREETERYIAQLSQFLKVQPPASGSTPGRERPR
jgi:predicted Zn-dependent protease